jgi:hypothetical protein
MDADRRSGDRRQRMAGGHHGLDTAQSG